MSCDSRRSEYFYLPQYGFGTETEFKKLVEQNPFLYRVHSPKSSTHLDVPFPALRFDGRYTYDAGSPSVDPPAPTYTDVAQHMEWTTRHASPYISSSFSFMWAIWEAARRYHFGVKHDVEIAVIDASSIPARSITVVEILRSVLPAERHENHWKWFHFAQASQLVLVYGGIPQTAVLTSIPILHIVDKLPSYCLGPIAPQTPIERLKYLTQKPSFRTFCEAQSSNFLRAAPDARFLDSTAGAVRLALAFLGAWFHWMLHFNPPRPNDSNIFCDAAVAKVGELARAIARWPAPTETHMMWDAVIREIALLIGEEVKTHRRIAGEIARPASPAVSEIPSTPASDAHEDCAGDVSSPVLVDIRHYPPTPPPTPPPTLAVMKRAHRVLPFALTPHSDDVDVDVDSGQGTEKSPGTFHVTPEVVHIPASPPPSPVSTAIELPAPAETEVAPDIVVVPPTPATPDIPLTATHVPSRSETASCLLTGFLFGALIMVVLSQRRPAFYLHAT
ncbi:hypothetical protein DFH06DRAFT_1307865 [Mycena polygramma]|nr:hypothetical protein DFH06DRAFT_1307865 [Mycena polygramma]